MILPWSKHRGQSSYLLSCRVGGFLTSRSSKGGGDSSLDFDGSLKKKFLASLKFDGSLTKSFFLLVKLPLGGGSSSSDFHSTRDFHQ